MDSIITIYRNEMVKGQQATAVARQHGRREETRAGNKSFFFIGDNVVNTFQKRLSRQ